MKKLILLLAGSLVFAYSSPCHTRYPDHPNYGKPHKQIIGNTTILLSHLFSPDTITVITTRNVHTVIVTVMDMVERVEDIMDSLIYGFYYETEPAPWSIHFDF